MSALTDRLRDMSPVIQNEASLEAADHVEHLEDALDHIMRVTRQASRPTNRLKFIELRAKSALEDTEEWRDYDYPKNRQQQQENLRARAKDAEEKLQQVRVDSAELAAGSPMDGFEALPTQAQWDVAFSTALLAVESLFIDSQEQE